ncbi:MAG: AIR synthase-related protein [Coprococcus sp.]
MRDEIFSDRAMEIAGRNGVSAMHPIGEGGILAALWDMAEGAGIGLSVEMKKMTVRQETIEVCEVFHLNPYQLTSTGAVLMVTPKGEELKERLKRKVFRQRSSDTQQKETRGSSGVGEKKDFSTDRHRTNWHEFTK